MNLDSFLLWTYEFSFVTWKATLPHGRLTFPATYSLALNSFEDALKAVSSATIAEVGRDNKEVQDAMALEGAIPPLVALFKGKQLSVQVKGAMAVESLANRNPLIQRAFLERKLTKDLLKLLKVGIFFFFFTITFPAV